MKAICFRITLAVILLTLTELVAARPHVAPGTLLWQQNFNGCACPVNGDFARSVAVDKQGNVVATGFTINPGTIRDFTVAKSDRDGALLWQQILTGTGVIVFEPLPVAVDNQGNVGAGRLGGVAKFDRDGILLW